MLRLWFALTGVDLLSKAHNLYHTDFKGSFNSQIDRFRITCSDSNSGYILMLEAGAVIRTGYDNHREWPTWLLSKALLPIPNNDLVVWTEVWNEDYSRMEYGLYQSSSPMHEELKRSDVNYNYLVLLYGLGKLRQGNVDSKQFVQSLCNYGFKGDKVKISTDGLTGEPMFAIKNSNGNDSWMSVLKHFPKFIKYIGVDSEEG